MNKLKIVLAATLLAATTLVPAQAGLFDSVATSDWPTKQVTSKYKLNTYGYDVRVYEWVPKDNPNARCVFIAGNENSSGATCYIVSDNKKK